MSRFEVPEPAGDEYSPRHAYERAIALAGDRIRIERDSLGELAVPADAYWGIHTARALINFPITRRAIYNYPDLVIAFAAVKLAAARANAKLGDLEESKAVAIEQACREIMDGALHAEFRVGVIQGGAGTSTNMNANEVIANRALEILGHEKGDYALLHPIDDVNRSQSTNDTYPTSIKFAMGLGLIRLIAEYEALSDAFRAKGREFSDVLKIGRTQMQDAVPMTVGQEFAGWAHTLSEDRAALSAVIPILAEMNLGATAIGTGITADPRYAAAVRDELNLLSPVVITTAPDLIEATSDTGSFMTLSGVLKRAAVKLSKICNDLRLLSSGPQAGIGELRLPARQAGSSIMPGKVNPTQCEAMTMVCCQIFGNQTTITIAGSQGHFELNVYKPVMAHCMLQSIQLMSDASRSLTEHCIVGIRADEKRIDELMRRSLMLVTALAPKIGYDNAAKVAKTAHANGTTLKEEAIRLGLVTAAEFDRLVKPEKMTHPG